MVKLSSRLLGLTLFVAIQSCSESEIPPGLYDYQVARLLSNDSMKTWTVTEFRQDKQKNELSCIPQFSFTSDNDSIEVSTQNASCIDNTIAGLNSIGVLSSRDELFFTDSLVLNSGQYILIDDITYNTADLIFYQGDVRFDLQLSFP